MSDEFVSFDVAAKEAGVHKATIARKVSAGLIPAYVGIDRRRKLVRRDDVSRLLSPTPIGNRTKEGQDGAAA